jgi:hypothetical protein
MGGPVLPGEVVPFPSRCQAHFLAHRLGQLEAAYRHTASQLLPHLHPDDDLAASVVRVLAALDS